jgi:LacI family transcriptional regulator
MKKATLTQVAREAGVSVSTASVALNPGSRTGRVGEECARRVRAVAEQLGYVGNYMAQSMKRGRAEAIAVILDFGHEESGRPMRPMLGGGYFGAVIGAVEFYARQRDCLTSIIGPTESMRAPLRGLHCLRQRRFDGLIIPALSVRGMDLSEMVEDSAPAPLVLVDYEGSTPFPVVNYDSEKAIRLAVEHLAGLGHRELLWVGPERWMRTLANKREQLFIRSVWEAGIRGRSCLVARPGEPPSEESGLAEFLADRTREAVAAFLTREKRDFTGVICFNDAMAIGAMRAFLGVGLRVPRDVSVVGLGDIEAGLAIPRLSSVSHRLSRLGFCAAELLFEMIDHPELISKRKGVRVVVEPELRERESTGPAPVGLGS